MLAEFDFQAPPQPLETFPINQAKPRWTMYNMKAHVMPSIYWQMLKYESTNKQVIEVTLKSSNFPIFISVSGEIGRDRVSSGNWLTWECQDKHPERRVLLHRCLLVLLWIV